MRPAYARELGGPRLERTELSCDVVELGCVPSDEDHVEAGLGELVGERDTDVSGRAGEGCMRARATGWGRSGRVSSSAT